MDFVVIKKYNIKAIKNLICREESHAYLLDFTI